MTADLAADEENLTSSHPARGNSEFASINGKWREMGRVQLEAAADGLENLGGAEHAAKAEIVRRDRDYAEEQERSRREFETARAQHQMDHAAALADKQLSAAIDVAKATKFA